jgi:hypothetical protein
MPHIKWKDVADDLILGNWGNEDKEILNLTEFIEKSSVEKISSILLLDIAISLRVLRCHTFKEIPNTLHAIHLNTRKSKKRKIKK